MPHNHDHRSAVPKAAMHGIGVFEGSLHLHGQLHCLSITGNIFGLSCVHVRIVYRAARQPAPAAQLLSSRVSLEGCKAHVPRTDGICMYTLGLKLLSETRLHWVHPTMQLLSALQCQTTLDLEISNLAQQPRGSTRTSRLLAYEMAQPRQCRGGGGSSQELQAGNGCIVAAM